MRIDLLDGPSGNLKVGCNMKEDHKRIDRRDGVIIADLSKGRPSAIVYLTNCILVNRNLFCSGLSPYGRAAGPVSSTNSLQRMPFSLYNSTCGNKQGRFMMTQLEEKFLPHSRVPTATKRLPRPSSRRIIAAEPKGILPMMPSTTSGTSSSPRTCTTRRSDLQEADRRLSAVNHRGIPGVHRAWATPAKAWYMLVNCYLAMGREIDAYEAADKLDGYADSYVQFVNTAGISFRKTYKMLAGELLDQYAAAKSELEVNKAGV